MSSIPSPKRPPEAIRVHWANRWFIAFALIGGCGSLALLVSLALDRFSPSLSASGNELGAGILVFATVCVVALASLCILWSALSWLTGVPSIFRRGQFRITDLVLIVALLGNGAGLSFRLFGEESPVVAVLLTMVLGTWVMLATAWMLWLAKRLQEQGGGQRAFFLLIGWSFPLALVSIIGGPCGVIVLLWSLSEMDRGSEQFDTYVCWLGVSVLAVGLGFWVIRRAVWLYQDAVQAGEPGMERGRR
jgi:hypothetical protein